MSTLTIPVVKRTFNSTPIKTELPQSTTKIDHESAHLLLKQEFCSTIKKRKSSTSSSDLESSDDNSINVNDQANLNLRIRREHVSKDLILASLPTTCNATVSTFFMQIREQFLYSLERLKPSGLLGSAYYFKDAAILDYLYQKKIPCHILVQKHKDVWTRGPLGRIYTPKLNQSQARRRRQNPRNNAGKIAAINSRYRTEDELRMRYDRLEPYHQGRSPVECFGIAPQSHTISSLMHQKTIIYMNKENKPFAVWSGSFNFTFNASNSIETAHLIESEENAVYHYKEWWSHQRHAESLSWTKPDLAPERIAQ